MTRRGWAVRTGALAILAGVALGACGGGHASTSSTSPGGASPAGAPAKKPRGPARGPARGGRAELRADLSRELHRFGSSSGAYVYDVTAGRSVFSLAEGIGRAPASVEKLYTTVALLDLLGPAARLRTTVLGTGHLIAGGVWTGDLYLRGGGDPTFGAVAFNRVWEGIDGAAISDLVGALRAHGIRRVSGTVIGDGSIFDGARGGPSTGMAADVVDLGGQLDGLTYDHGAAGPLSPAAFAARQLMLALRAAHVDTGGGSRDGVTPTGARPLASVSSPALSEVLRLMNVPSDDFYAEMLTKQLGRRFGDAGSTAAGAAVIAHDMASAYGIHPTVVDGSGLSRANRSSPIQVVDLLRAVWGTPVGETLAASLPSVGIEGTVRRIATQPPARGRCIAKTGTLNAVTNLAGYCHGAAGQVLAFALFIDGPSNEQGVGMLGRMVTDMVALDATRP